MKTEYMKQRVLSGMQPSGRLHLGNLFGALQNWVEFQDEYDCFYFVADWHALSTSYEDTHEIRGNVFHMVVDWLAAGLDPDKCTIFLQSDVQEHAVLQLLLSMITPVSWLERNPTYKEKMDNLEGRDLTTHGFLGYPVLQASDILLYKADFVPVGIDQLPHLEFTREVVRRFHHLFKREVFVEPEAKMAEVTKMPGLDGRKMSKSYGNAIFISDPPETVRKKVKGMVTDTQRVRRKDPGDPDVCGVFTMHKIFSGAREIDQVFNECQTAGIGCIDCKLILSRNISDYLKPVQEKREEILSRPERIQEVLVSGRGKAKEVAGATLEEAHQAMGISG